MFFVDGIRYDLRTTRGVGAIRPMIQLCSVAPGHPRCHMNINQPPTDKELDYYVKTGLIAPEPL